jgi:EAL domain-containing protein (putative c-di-GMP-specific phosphodiesterase class I)
MEKVCFEITETAGIGNLSDAAEFILKMKKTGCLFSLDDFGSGHSSYAYLKNLPVDFLKIDGAFVRNMDHSATDYAVVKSITEVGHFMGKKIIAEYAETPSVLERLKEIGVDYAQGYAVDVPRRLEEVLGGHPARKGS